MYDSVMQLLQTHALLKLSLPVRQLFVGWRRRQASKKQISEVGYSPNVSEAHVA